MKDYPAYRRDMLKLVTKLRKEQPETLAAFGQLHQASTKEGVLSTRQKELIALAIAVTVRCDGCIASHVSDALRAGATREEIGEALDVAILMGGGPAAMYAAQAMNAVDQFLADAETR